MGKSFQRWLRKWATVLITEPIIQHFNERLDRIEERLQIMPTTQEYHDAILAAAADLKSHTDAAAQRVVDALAGLQAKIDALVAANPAVDFSDVQAALGTVKDEVDSIAPTPPPPTP